MPQFFPKKSMISRWFLQLSFDSSCRTLSPFCTLDIEDVCEERLTCVWWAVSSPMLIGDITLISHFAANDGWSRKFRPCAFLLQVPTSLGDLIANVFQAESRIRNSSANKNICWFGAPIYSHTCTYIHTTVLSTVGTCTFQVLKAVRPGQLHKYVLSTNESRVKSQDQEYLRSFSIVLGFQ